MMRLLAMTGLLTLAACGGGTSGTNYSDPPPMAEIVATPSPTPSATPEASTPDVSAVEAVDNAVEASPAD